MQIYKNTLYNEVLYILLHNLTTFYCFGLQIEATYDE